MNPVIYIWITRFYVMVPKLAYISALDLIVTGIISNVQLLCVYIYICDQQVYVSFRNKKKIVQENPKAQEFNKPGTRNLELPDVPTFNRERNKNLPSYLKANLEIEKYCCNMAVSHDDSSPKKSQCTI